MLILAPLHKTRKEAAVFWENEAVRAASVQQQMEERKRARQKPSADRRAVGSSLPQTYCLFIAQGQSRELKNVCGLFVCVCFFLKKESSFFECSLFKNYTYTQLFSQLILPRSPRS